MTCMYLVPLEAPLAIIPLQDELIESLFYSGRRNLKDLFFSGHTATLFVFSYCFTNLKLKWLYLTGGVIVGILLLLQHVHYSIDVMAAPVFTYYAVAFQRKINFQEERTLF